MSIGLSQKKKERGFTLLEMIAVIVIISLISVAGTSIVIALIKGRILVNEQSQVIINSQLTVDRLSKQLRMALPYSLRTSNGNRCLKFLTIVSSGFYLNELPDRDNGSPPSGRNRPIEVASYGVSDGNASFISVGAGSSSEIYGNSSDSLVAIASRTNSSITLQQNHRWQRNSPEQRFFLTDTPKAFCLIDNELRYYNNISQTRSQVDTSAPYDLLMNNIDSSGRIFNVEDSNNGCQHCVIISLMFTDSDVVLDKIITVSLLYAH